MNDTPVFSSAAVAAPHRLAAQAGRDVLAQGGNAIEAMVAMAASIAVVYPHMNAIGGDGFWIIREPRGKTRAIEACGFAGENATIANYRLEDAETIPTRGPRAALDPGSRAPSAAGRWRWSSQPRSAAACRSACCSSGRSGTRPTAMRSPPPKRASIRGPSDRGLIEAPGFAETYFIEGKPAKAGAIRKFVKLGETLGQLAHAGLDDFYRGDVAREIAGDLERIGAPVTRVRTSAGPIAPCGASRCRCASKARRSITRRRRRRGWLR